MIISNFLFHRVSPEKDPLWQPIAPSHFRRIVRHVKKHYKVVAFEEEFPMSFEKISKKPLATIMFDDGFQDNLDYAADILWQERCPASFYVVTDCIETGTPTWTYCLDYRILNTQSPEVAIDSPVLPDSHKKFSLLSYEERISCGKQLKPFLKTIQQNERLDILTQIETQLSDCEVPACMMNWEQVAQLASDGFKIGSHSVTHPLLATIEDPVALTYELTHSRERIRNVLGTSPRTISYPIGSVSTEVIEASRKAGYEIGLAVENRTYDNEADDAFSVPRIELYNESWAKTLLRMHGWVHRVKSWRKAG